jgi:excisionase family DNA binding protein
MTTVETPTLLSVRDVAAHLRVSRATAYRLIHAGELPAVRVGGQLRVDRDELNNYIYGEEQP